LIQDSSQVEQQQSEAVQVIHARHDTTAVRHLKVKAAAFKADTVSTTGPAHSISPVTVFKKDTTHFSASTERNPSINLFGSHELNVMHNGPQSLNRVTPDWIFPLLLLLLAAFAWLRAYYNKYFIQIVSAFFNNNLTNQVVRDENILVQRASVLLNVVFNLVAASFLYFVSVHYSWPVFGIGTGFNRYLFFALLVSAAYTIKFFILKICGYLFKLDREMAAYLFNISLINNMVGIVLIPVVAMLAFSVTINTGWVISGSVVLVACGFVYQLFRGLSIGISSPFFSLYYLFLYLCTLEFAPIAVLIKVLTEK